MIERMTSTDTVIAAVLWAVCGLLYIVAAGFMFSGHGFGGILVAEVACGVSAYAAVRTIRCYAIRACRKIDDLALERDVARLTRVPGQRVH